MEIKKHWRIGMHVIEHCRANRIVVIFIITLFVCSKGFAYELETHGQLSNHAYLRSNLEKDITLIESLQLDILNNNNPFGEFYYDFDPDTGDIIKRKIYEFEKERMGDSGDFYKAIRGWIMRGAVREDDVAFFGENPKDDPVC